MDNTRKMQLEAMRLLSFRDYEPDDILKIISIFSPESLIEAFEILKGFKADVTPESTKLTEDWTSIVSEMHFYLTQVPAEKIKAIKLFRVVTNAGLKEAKEQIDHFLTSGDYYDLQEVGGWLSYHIKKETK